ncbi:MAG: DUF4097 family beta strand repeat protein [Candidatus Cloacimonetes bacterium]|nr:DUF4097 family beta strand repeat protein [Candidatus Cloacimonadota bacterium]
MKKVMLILVLMVISMILIAITEKVAMRSDKIELIFDNVKIKDISFYPEKEIEVNYSKSDEVTVVKEKNVLKVSSGNYAKVSLKLPETKDYIYRLEDAKCEFNAEKVVIYSDDGEIVEFSGGNLIVTESEGSNRVEVGSEGIFVTSDDEVVEISSRGIIVETDDESKHLTGFWGKLLGGFIKLVAKSSISLVGKDPGKLMKQIINDKDNTFAGSFVHINIDDEDGELITKEFQDTFQPKKGSNVNVYNKNGNIEIRSWKEDYIDIFATMKTRKDEEEFEKVEIKISDRNGCTIETKHLEKNPKVSVNYEIKVPKSVKLNEIESSNGKVLIVDCKGDININTSNGKIEVFDTSGDLEASTSNGKVEIVNVDGKVNISTSNGSIRVVRTPRLEKARTSNGSIKVELGKMENDIMLLTSNGSIKIYLDPSINADIKASTSNSSIKLHDIEVTTRKFSNNYLVGSIAKGGKLITADTSNGRISLYKLEK